jgi:hypothetical protein
MTRHARAYCAVHHGCSSILGTRSEPCWDPCTQHGMVCTVVLHPQGTCSLVGGCPGYDKLAYGSNLASKPGLAHMHGCNQQASREELALMPCLGSHARLDSTPATVAHMLPPDRSWGL